MSAAVGMFSAESASSCACTARSRASKARPIVPETSGFSNKSVSALPSLSSVPPVKRSRRPAAALLASDTARRVACAVQMRLFTFVQMEIPWELGPADGRYLLRKLDGPRESEVGGPEYVVVLGTVGAARKTRLGKRSLVPFRVRTRATDAEPTPVAVARATVVDPVSLSSEGQARAWLGELDPDREAAAAAAVLNRMLFAHRIAGATPHLHEVSPTQALVLRAGYGEGEQVADGLWVQARELVLSQKRAGRRASVLRPHERLALLLSGRDKPLQCEELVLRARLDLDAGRPSLAALRASSAPTRRR